MRCAKQSAIPALWLQSATPALRIRFGTLRHWYVKFLPRIFYSFWAPHGRKLRICLFDRRATKTWVRSFCGTTMGQIFEILTWRNFGPLRQWSRKFPSRIYFGRPMTKNYDSVFLTGVRPKPRVRSFRPSCDYFPISVLLTNGATNGGLKILPKLVTSWKLTENFAKLSKGCFSRSHTWSVYVQFFITISSPWTPWSKGLTIFVISGPILGLNKKKNCQITHYFHIYILNTIFSPIG